MFKKQLMKELALFLVLLSDFICLADTAVDPNSNQKEMLLEVKAKKKLIQASSSASSTQINREEIAHLPQGSEISLPKLISVTTPGVVLGPFGQTFFRGNHANIQFQIDGVQVPDSPASSLGQAISPRNIEKLEILTGGIPAEYGQRLAAVVNIVTRTGPEEPEGELELNYGTYNTVSPHLIYGGSTESGHIHYFLSANYNQTDRGLDTPQPVSESDQTQGGKDAIHDVAHGNSEFARVDWFADELNKVSFMLSNFQSYYQIPNYPSSFQPTDPFFQVGFKDSFGNQKTNVPTYNYVPSNTNDTQSEIDTYAQVVWKHTFSERSFLKLAPYYKYSSIVVTNDPTNDLAALKLIPGAEPSSFAQNRHINNLGLRTDYSTRPHESHLIKMGTQLQVSRSDGFVSIQTSLNSPPMTESSPSTGYFESVYIQDDYTIFKPLILNAGLRFDATQFSFSGENSTDSLLQPRIGLNYMMTDTTKFHVFYGKLFQPASIENLRYAFNAQSETSNTLQPYDIKAEKDDFYEAGVAQQLFEQQLFSLNVYYKNGINILDDQQLLNTSIAQPYNFSTGYAYGTEFSVRGKVTEDWSEFANYSYSIAKGKGISGGIWTGVSPSNDYQFLDHVQIHTVNSGLTYSKNYFWWTGQGLFGSGLRTGSNNSINLPSHLTFDTSLGYQFHGKSWLSQLKLSGDVLNIFDNVYPITIANGFNGSHYAAGRMFFVRLVKNL